MLVMPHTDCGMTKVTDDDVHAIAAERGVDTRSLDFHTVPDQGAALRHDLTKITTSRSFRRACRSAASSTTCGPGN